jgi:lysozyme
MFHNHKPIFDAIRAVAGPLSQAEVGRINAAIAASAPGNDKAIYDIARAIDEDGKLDKFEAGLIQKGIAAAATGSSVPRGSSRQIGAAGLEIVKRNEGLRLKAYICPAGVLTIGYGSTGPHVRPGMVITEAEADRLLNEDLDRFEEAVKRYAGKATQNQFDAMVSLAFNIGIANFRKSSVLRAHVAGNYAGAANAFALWNKAKVGGVLKELAGLTRRRAEEARLYRKPGS